MWKCGHVREPGSYSEGSRERLKSGKQKVA